MCSRSFRSALQKCPVNKRVSKQSLPKKILTPHHIRAHNDTQVIDRAPLPRCSSQAARFPSPYPPASASAPPTFLQQASLTNLSFHLHNPPLPFGLHTTTANRALHPTSPAPSPHACHPRHEPSAAETFRATARLWKRILRQIPGQEQAAGRVGQGGVCTAGATACGSVRRGDGDAGGGERGEYGPEDYYVSAGMG